MQDSTGATGYGYDSAGRLNSVINPHGFNVSYLYDALGNLSELTYPGSKRWLNPRPKDGVFQGSIKIDGKIGNHGVLCEAANPLEHYKWMFC